MRRQNLILEIAVSCSLACSANASDLANLEPSPKIAAFSGVNWAGFYVGANLGYGTVHSSGAVFDNYTLNPYGFDGGGRVYGVYTGYNYLINSAVFGVETEWQGGDLEASFVPDQYGSSFSNNYRIDTKIKNYRSFRGRVGYTTGKFLIFAAPGWAYGEYSTTYKNLNTNEDITHKVQASGLTLGVGLEYAFSSNVLGRVEYVHTDLGSSLFAPPYDYIGDIGNRVQIDDVRIGVSYKF